MNLNPEDPVQFGVYTFMTVINECDQSNTREAKLATFLKGRLQTMQTQANMKGVITQIAIGSNAIISSLDGSAEWHPVMLDVANMLFDGVNGAFHDWGEPLKKKAQFGDPLSTELVEDDSYQNSPQSIAQDPSTPLETLVELSKSDDWKIRSAVATNPSSPEELLRELSTDSDEGVRSYTARNPNTPIDALKRLSLDESEYVRDFLAQNPAIPLELMQRLANDPHWRPRSGVAENPNAPEELLDKLLFDPDERVVDIARQNPNCRISYGYDEDIPF